jgi:putative glutamine amidotransferase
MNAVNAPPAPKPLVLLPACNRTLGGHPFHTCGKKYVDAVHLAGCQPLVLPSAAPDALEALLGAVHGVLLTGSPSNVHPSHFGEAVHDPSLPLDAERDAVTLPLVRGALSRGMPLLTICRGTQEANVALGGSLHQAVQEVQPHFDHRAVPDAEPEVAYAERHEVFVEPGGLLERILAGSPAGAAGRFRVNSLHGQAANRLADGLRVEARAEDGVVEAISLPAARGFFLGLQWHPEWQAARNPVSLRLLGAFGEACRTFRDRPKTPLPA